jgi:transposase
MSDTNDPAVYAPATNLADVSDHLTVPQHAVLSLLASGQSVSAAAESAGIHRGTVYRWLSADPNFKAAYTAWRRETLELAAGRLAKLSDDAVGVVAQALQSLDARTAVAVLRGLGLLSGRRPGGSADPQALHRQLVLRRQERDAKLDGREEQMETHRIFRRKPGKP